MILISNIILEVLEGSTVPSTSIFGTASVPKQTYFNIGSGNVFKLRWNTPVLTNDIVDHYSLVVKRYDTLLSVYYDIFSKNIGLVNEFCVDSELLPTVPEQYVLSIYLVAYGKNGSIITSNVVSPYVSKGSGTYIKARDLKVGNSVITYEQPIMKRAITFVNATHKKIPIGAITIEAEALEDALGEALMDAEGKSLFADTPEAFESEDGWSVVRETSIKTADVDWLVNNIMYEALVDVNGNFITDINNEPLYIL